MTSYRQPGPEPYEIRQAAQLGHLKGSQQSLAEAKGCVQMLSGTS